MERELRRQQNLLVDAGMGMVMFGIWGVVKINMFLALSSDFAEAWQIALQESEIAEEYFLVGFWVAIAIYLVLVLFSRLYIGMSAVAEGKGKKKGYAYILMTAVLLVFNLHTNWYIYTEEQPVVNLNWIMGILLDMASLQIMMELVISAIRVKRLRKKMKK